jgi:hypothetical protein
MTDELTALLGSGLATFWPMAEQLLKLVMGVPWVARLLLALWLLWVFYLAVMNLQRVRDAGKLGRVALTLGLPVLLVGIVLDVFCNLVLFSVLLAELPREWTVTARLKRHKRTSTGYRKRVADWFGSELLDHFDPSGAHL